MQQDDARAELENIGDGFGDSDASSEASSEGGDNPFEEMDPETSRNPQPSYKLMRELAPTIRVPRAGVIVSRRADVEQVLHNPDIFSSALEAAPLGNIRPLIPLQIDPPEHRKFRKILQPLFSPQRMAELEKPIAEIVRTRIDGFADRDEIDFAQEFSVPFPSQVFLTLLGLPHEELPLFLKMKDAIIRPQHVIGVPTGHRDAIAYQREMAASIYDYFNRILDLREQDPRDDLLSQFLLTEVEGDRLSREDILDICFLFLIAGLDTVSASLDCFFRYLAEHPDKRQVLVADDTVVPSVVEELLRWETPVVGVPRIATSDVEVGGCPISKGEHVTALIGSANTDEAEYPDADDVRWDRDANRHLAFGGGIHRCLGSHLARVELRVALREWHARIPDYRIKPGVDLNFTPGIRSVDSFPMILGVSL
jgi:cytochrome P450